MGLKEEEGPGRRSAAPRCASPRLLALVLLVRFHTGIRRESAGLSTGIRGLQMTKQVQRGDNTFNSQQAPP